MRSEGPLTELLRATTGARFVFVASEAIVVPENPEIAEAAPEIVGEDLEIVVMDSAERVAEIEAAMMRLYGIK